ncbi:MAG: radical SAM protein [Myxococcota bacterium]
MSCISVDDGTWMRAFNERAFKERIPVSGMLELTSRCNLRCVHCYLGSQEEQHKKRSLEMDTERVKAVIDEMAAAGCMFLVITGGDPMMRKDFPEIFVHAKRQGMFVTVFCDGVLVTEKIVELFKEWPPRTVEISLYGATAETYEKVTRIPGSYDKCIRGIERLLDAGIDVALKTVLMTVNEHELEAMREIARGYGCKFRFDAAIFPCLPDSSKDPLELRVDPKRAVELEMQDEKARDGWLKYHETRKNNPPKETLFRCGAGLTSFYVGPLGELSPCVMTTQYRYSSDGATFRERWDNELRELRAAKPKRADYECNSCGKRTLCSGCPAFNWLESGESDKKSDYVCATTHARWDAVFGDDSSPGHRLLKIVK